MPNNQPHIDLDRDYARLLLTMQRLIRDEFDVRIRIVADDALEQMLSYAEKSFDMSLQEMGRELKDRITQAAPAEDTEEEGEVVYYRGVARVIKPEEGKTSVDEQENRPVRIYRGQKVYA